MLIEKILDGLTAIIEFIAKIIMFLLKALGLWIPAVYSLLFVIVIAIFKIPFEAVSALFFVGLALSLIFAFYIMCMRVIGRKNRRYLDKQKKRAAAKALLNEKQKAKEEKAELRRRKREERSTVGYGSEQLPDGALLPPEKPLDFETEISGSNAVENGSADSPGYEQTQDRGYDKMQGYRPTQEPTRLSESSFDVRRADDIVTKPKIFKTRMDPSLLIFEYPDRLVFYRKTDSGLEHIRTERK